jgi:Ca-activated chloride channel family protein
MSAIRFHHTEMLLLLWAIPLLIGAFVYAGYKRRQALERFAEANLLPLINTSIHISRRRWKAGLQIIAFGFCALAVARPAWNPVPKTLDRWGRDVMFILDLSKSMLAEDLVPNRLERSKLSILDCVERLQGDRVGLTVFAGNAVVKCPLTLDYGFFRMMLEDVSPDSAARGGTMIGDAIRKALDEGFDDREKKHKDILLITDGEDHDSFPVEAAEEAGERGVRLIAIGIGDEEQGKRIPITDESGQRTFLKYNGQEIWSKLDADTLRKMVNATPGGRYLNVATGTIDLGDVYMKLIVNAEKKALESLTVNRYEEKFQIFVALVFILLCAELVLSQRRRIDPERKES